MISSSSGASLTDVPVPGSPGEEGEEERGACSGVVGLSGVPPLLSEGKG